MSDEKRPPGVALLFAPRAEIEAAPAGERAAYYVIVEGFLANPEAAGFRYETAADFDADDKADAETADDWGGA